MSRLDIRRLREISELVRSMGWTGFGKSLVAFAVADVLAAVLGLVNSVFAVPRMFLTALADAGVAIVNAVIVDPLGIPRAGADTAIQSLTTGFFSLLGPLAFPVGVASVFLGYAVLSVGFDALDWDVPGFDVPGVSLFGNDEGET